MKKLILGVTAALVTLFLITANANAATLYGVDIAEKSTLDGESLALNGVGLRKKGPFKVYLVALYTTKKTPNVTRLLSQGGPKRIELRMLRKVVKRNIVSAIIDGFKDNTRDMASIQARVDEFSAYMETTRKGDNIQFDFIPGSGTSIIINGTNKGTIVGKDFFDALMKVWIGNNPVNRELKASMLGV